MAIKEVCRLCLQADEHELVWVFDKRFDSSDSMKDVIHITTGVEITLKDIISQKICTKCCQVTVKMFEFRRTSQKNDKYLREQCKLSLKDKEIKIPNTEVTIRSEAKKDEKTDPKPDIEIRQESKPSYKIHPTVRDLFKTHPQIRLPTVCLKYNIAPCVSMKMDQVEQYFKKHNMDFEEHTKLALRAGRVAAKRTSSVAPRAPKNKISKLEEATPFKVKWNFTPSADATPKTIPGTTNKRKSCDEETADSGETKKTNFIESLGLTAKPPETPGSELSFVANKSLPLHICEICNSVQYSAKDLRRHQYMHMRCQFCKVRLRSLESKQAHLATECPIKNMMNNLPNVVIQKVELTPWICKAYPRAFEDFSLPAEPEEESEVPEEKEDSDSEIVTVTENIEPEQTQPCEVIEILSDDEDHSTSDANKPPLTDNPAGAPPANVSQPPPTSNLVYSTVSIVRPDIKIKGNDVLDTIDARVTDIKVLKELLTHYRPVSLFADNHAQTERPHNKSITVHLADMTGELRLLKSQLYVYKVPVELSKGSFDVRYDYSAGSKPPRRLNLWNDLTVLDVKTPNPRPSFNVPNENVNPQNKIVVTPTPNKPLQTTSKFIRVNTSSLSPISTSNGTMPTVSLVSRNPMLNQIIENVQTATTEASVGAKATAQAASVDAAQPFGVIRVKNVWELT